MVADAGGGMKCSADSSKKEAGTVTSGVSVMVVVVDADEDVVVVGIGVAASLVMLRVRMRAVCGGVAVVVVSCVDGGMGSSRASRDGSFVSRVRWPVRMNWAKSRAEGVMYGLARRFWAVLDRMMWSLVASSVQSIGHGRVECAAGAGMVRGRANNLS